MGHRPVVFVVALLCLGCDDPPTVPEPVQACAPAVRVGGIVYEAQPLPEPAAVRAIPFALVRRQVPCADRPGIPAVALGEGESNFLAPGTGLHAIVGHPPGQRIAVRDEEGGRWVVLVAGSR